MLFFLKKWCNPWNYKVCNKKYSGRFDTTLYGEEVKGMDYCVVEYMSSTLYSLRQPVFRGRDDVIPEEIQIRAEGVEVLSPLPEN